MGVDWQTALRMGLLLGCSEGTALGSEGTATTQGRVGVGWELPA